jgi:hypothetical protein
LLTKKRSKKVGKTKAINVTDSTGSK